MAKYELPKPPWFNASSDYLKLIIAGKQLIEQSSNTRDEDNMIRADAVSMVWEFVAPNEIMENLNHTWGEYEAIAARVNEKVGEVTTAMQSVGNLGGALKEAAGGNWMNAGAQALGLTQIPDYRVDAPLYYQNSARLEYTLNFNLAYTGSGGLKTQSSFSPSPLDSLVNWASSMSEPKSDFADNLRKSLYEPITELQKYSCPEQEGALAKIDYPYVFEIYTDPVPIINIKAAAITSIQPTWKSPFVKGYPLGCDLTITFIDIRPLFRRTFDLKLQT